LDNELITANPDNLADCGLEYIVRDVGLPEVRDEGRLITVADLIRKEAGSRSYLLKAGSFDEEARYDMDPGLYERGRRVVSVAEEVAVVI
jgi:hypothetical protein